MISFNKEKIIFLIIIISAITLRLISIGNFDVSPDEEHYIQDAYRYLTGDPYIVPRHHMFMHPSPSIGHPFLAQHLFLIAFKLFSISVDSARSVMAIANILGMICTFILALKLFGKKVAFISIFLISLLPLDVRYARDAHLDPLLSFTYVLSSLLFWIFLKRKEIIWGILLGISTALVLATKISGPSIFIFYFVGIIFLIGFKNLKTWFLKSILQTSAAILTFLFTFVLLVDPRSYLNAILNPTDPAFKISSLLHYFIQNAPYFLSKMMINLYTLPFVIIIVLGMLLVLKRRKKEDLFLLSILLSLTPTIVTHSGISGEYGYIIFNPYFAMLGAIFISTLKVNYKNLVILIVLICMVPYLILNALRIDVGPFTQTAKFNDSNFRFGQITYKKAIDNLNRLPDHPKVLWVRDKDRQVPMLEVSPNVSLWPLYKETEVDTVLTADFKKVVDLKRLGFYLYKELKYKNDSLYILRLSYAK